jgi:hypothetical protein
MSFESLSAVECHTAYSEIIKSVIAGISLDSQMHGTLVPYLVMFSEKILLATIGYTVIRSSMALSLLLKDICISLLLLNRIYLEVYYLYISF